MTGLETLFWSLAGLIIYTYLGYGFLLWIMVQIKRFFSPKKVVKLLDQNQLPAITLIIPAYNEREILLDKIANCKALNYPKDRLDIWFVIDGSDDGSEELLAKYSEVKVFHQPQRAGKIAAVNRIMPLVNTELVVFTDANTMLNKDAILHLVKHFANPKVGCVAGEKRVSAPNTAGQGEGLYWKYESRLKAWSAELYSTIGAAGELYAMRTALFTPPPSDTILDDFIISLNTIKEGYQLSYSPEAYALEQGSVSLEEELKRKIRICAGGIQSIARTLELLNPFKTHIFSFMYLSHRILRWTITPIALLVVFFLNVYLSNKYAGIYFATLLLQFSFYILAIRGWLNRDGDARPIFLVPCYFTMMNVAVFLGFARFIRKKQSVLWEKTERVV